MRLGIAMIGILILCEWAFAERYAVLVGNNNARGDFAQLKYVENDIKGLRTILNDFCGFEKHHIVTLYNGAPEDLDRLLAEAAKQVSLTKNSMFLFYFSGHADQEHLKMGDADYPLDTLKEKLTVFPADIRIGVFDACRSGSVTRLKGGVLSEPFLFKNDGRSKGQVFLSSSSVSENAQEFDAYRNSIFTFHLINALRGSADVSGDSKVTLSEAYHYAFNHTLSSTAGSQGGTQHPSYQFRIQGEGDIVLADLNIRSQGILMGRGVWGALTVFNEQSGVVADLTKEKNTAVMIALGPGTYRIVNIQGAGRLEAAAAVRENGVVTVGESDFLPVKPAASSAGKKGRSAPTPVARLGIGIAGVYERFDLSALGAGLSERFGDFGLFSMRPGFYFPRRIRYPAFWAEGILFDRLLGRLGGGSFSFSSVADYSGKRQSGFDGRYYDATLQTDKNLSVTVVDMDMGHRWNSGYLRGGFAVAGLAFYGVKLTVSSVFSDSLFNVRSPGSERVGTIIVLPYLGAGYALPLTRFCEIGGELRYRSQRRPQALGRDLKYPQAVSDTVGSGAQAPLEANFRGFSVRAYVNFNVKI